MKISKFWYNLSLIISTFFGTLFYTLLPFLVAMAIVMFFGIPAYFLGPIMLVIYVWMSEWNKMKSAMNLLGVFTDGDEDDEE